MDALLEVGPDIDPEVMHANLLRISRVYRWGYYDGLYGTSPSMRTPRYNAGYERGSARWQALLSQAKG